MRYPIWTAEQFLDASSLNAMTTAVSGDFNALGGAALKPGLCYPEVASFAASGLTVNSTLPFPFGVCFGSGTIAHAHGAVTGLDVTAYATSFSGAVPGSGSVTAYLLASLGSIQENPYTNIGPPVGHPDFNPNFQPATAYALALDTLLLSASTTPPDNLTTFELARCTLAAGATGLVLSTVFQNRASASNTMQVRQVVGNTTLSVSAHGGRMIQAVAPCTLTLPAASGCNNVSFSVTSLTTGAVALQTQGADLLVGYGAGATASGVPSISLANDAVISVGCFNGLWEVTGGNSTGLGTGGLIGVRVFSTVGSSGYVPTLGTKSVIVEAVGGGGAGAGALGTVANGTAIGGPGAAGAYGRSLYTSGFSGVTVTVGSGGLGVAGGGGSNGGTSSFGGLLSCPGGGGGNNSAAVTTPIAGGNGSQAAPTGANIIGVAGGAGGLSLSLNASCAFGAPGGDSAFGAGAVGATPGFNGGGAFSPGSGGGGTANFNNGSALTGGNGAKGLVIIYEYAS